MKKIVTTVVIIGLAALFLLKGAFKFGGSKPSKVLPYYGQKELATNGKDSVEHYIKDFSFVNQEGKTITQKNLDGCIYVADYFFCTCQSICPIMSDEMELLAKHYKGDKEIKFISHTVNPENDSVPVLADYAKAHHADPSQWFLVTGDKKELYNLARTSYLIAATTGTGDGGVNDFIHSEYFVLVDKEKHIRAMYDGTNHKDMLKLMEDIEVLKKEYQNQ
jgi:protein SCO1/2